MTGSLAGWRHSLLAACLGAIAAFGQAPYDLPVLLIFGLAGAVYCARWALTPRAIAIYGWAFGTGYFLHALQWIVSPFMVDVARHGWMAPFALILLAAGLALFWGAAFWAAWRVGRGAIWPLVLTLPAVEMVRAYIFTGFPWAMPAQAVLDTPLASLLAHVGPHGVNLVLTAIVLLPLAASTGLPRLVAAGTLGVLALAVFAFYVPPAAQPALTGHTIRLVQPNAPQREKWDPEKIPVFFNRQLEYTAAPPQVEGRAPDLVLWSETAIPWRLDHAAPVLPDIAAAGGDAIVALGVQRAGEAGFHNSLAVLGAKGAVDQVYDKHHLVPFGEYVPFADLLNRIGIFGLAQQLPAGYRPGPGPKLVDFGPLGRALPLICYEAVFPQDVNAAPERPEFMIQITNDAWFGRGAGPRQHLAQARMRAIEQGLPLARAANTGISAMIGPRGQIIASLPLNQAGFVDAPLPAPLAPTLYARTGDGPLAALLFVALAGAALRARRAARV